EQPIEWMLLTTLPITTLAEGLQCLTWYTYRWRIERYHYILKSGCQIEKLQLETKDRLMRALAVYSIVASRLLRLTYQARETPEAPCTEALSESEWRALYTATHKRTIVPKHPPTMQTAILWIAKLGGFLGRKHDGNPGLKVLWRGFRRLHDLTTMWEIFHPPNTYG
ncbi:MAG: IS4 family transposase, partial [Firmicutes bacterium]|nr:IS4 family transposase [Bacillota bacterium]